MYNKINNIYMNYISIISSINTHTSIIYKKINTHPPIIYKKIIYIISYKMPIKKPKNTSNHTPGRGGCRGRTPTHTHNIKKNKNTQPPQKTHKPHSDQVGPIYIILGTYRSFFMEKRLYHACFID